MDLEQIVKRLEWLDDERRKDKLVIATLQERLSGMETNSSELLQQLKEQSGELTRMMASLSRFEKIDEMIGQIRLEFNRKTEEIEKQRTERERELYKERLSELEVINKSLGDLRQGFDTLTEVKKTLNLRMEEEFRLARLVEELEHKFEAYARTDEDSRRLQKMLEEGRRQDTKRVMDIQNESSTLRKRSDEQRGKIDLITDSLRKAEMRIGDLLATETERRQDQNSFMEKQNLLQLERDRVWKEWQTRFEEFSNRTSSLDSQLQSLDAMERSVKRSKEAFDDMTTRLERRINEITEMQRLMEERFRQEWMTYKADDQKRWTYNSLSLEEQGREANRQIIKFEERMVHLEDLTQAMRDVLEQMLGNTQKRLNKEMTMYKEWMDLNESLQGQIR